MFSLTSPTCELVKFTLKTKHLGGFFLYWLIQYFKLLKIFLCPSTGISHIPLLICKLAAKASSMGETSDTTESSVPLPLGPLASLLSALCVTAPSWRPRPFSWGPGGHYLCYLLVTVTKVSRRPHADALSPPRAKLKDQI